jgi:ABC-2 type transport system permease protein
MTRWQQVTRIARWEFNRFVKWRQQAYGILIMLVVGGISGGLGKMAKEARGKPSRVAVIGSEKLGFAMPPVDGVTWVPNQYSSEPQARAAITADSVAGALVVDGPGAAHLVLRKRSAWSASVGRAMTAAQQAALYTSLPLDAAQRTAMSTPFAVDVSTITLRNGTSDSATRLFTGIILFFGVLVLFNGFASLFAGITGEKQQRITEQIIAMVSPQTWMDGKILGLVGAALVGTLLFAATGLAVAKVLPALLGSSPITMTAPSDPLSLLIVLLVTVLGVGMWFSFMAAIAATIDDPNSSPRSAMLLIPVLPMGLAFTLLSRPDTWLAQLLAVFPLTSMAVLPVRLLMTSVPWWEPVLAVLLLAAATWTFRRAAGKIFAIGILMHGKEPSLRETWRWLRETE